MFSSITNDDNKEYFLMTNEEKFNLFKEGKFIPINKEEHFQLYTLLKLKNENYKLKLTIKVIIGIILLLLISNYYADSCPSEEWFFEEDHIELEYREENND